MQAARPGMVRNGDGAGEGRRGEGWREQQQQQQQTRALPLFFLFLSSAHPSRSDGPAETLRAGLVRYEKGDPLASPVPSGSCSRDAIENAGVLL